MCSRPQFTDLTYMGGTRPCGPMTIIFGSVISSLVNKPKYQVWCESDVHVLKIPVTDLTDMGGTGPCGPMTIIFGSVR